MATSRVSWPSRPNRVGYTYRAKSITTGANSRASAIYRTAGKASNYASVPRPTSASNIVTLNTRGPASIADKRIGRAFLNPKSPMGVDYGYSYNQKKFTTVAGTRGKLSGDGVSVFWTGGINPSLIHYEVGLPASLEMAALAIGPNATLQVQTRYGAGGIPRWAANTPGWYRKKYKSGFDIRTMHQHDTKGGNPRNPGAQYLAKAVKELKFTSFYNPKTGYATLAGLDSFDAVSYVWIHEFFGAGRKKGMARRRPFILDGVMAAMRQYELEVRGSMRKVKSVKPTMAYPTMNISRAGGAGTYMAIKSQDDAFRFRWMWLVMALLPPGSYLAAIGMYYDVASLTGGGFFSSRAVGAWMKGYATGKAMPKIGLSTKGRVRRGIRRGLYGKRRH